jgi:FAD synthase
MRIIEGVVEHGDALGRELGFPTANVPVADDSLEDGVWVALVRCGWDQWVPAAVSIGRRRTFFSEDGPRLLEAHLLDFHGDLYGALMQVRLVTRIRSQERFPTAGGLVDQMHRDVRITREWAQTHLPWGHIQPRRSSAVKELV